MVATHIRVVIVILLLILGLVACGKTGPLYIPDDKIASTFSLRQAKLSFYVITINI